MLLGLYFCMKQAPKYGLTEDNVIDTVLWAIPLSIIGARIYYVLFLPRPVPRERRLNQLGVDLPHLGRRPCHLRRRHRGLFDGVYPRAAAKSFSFWALTDCCVQGLFIGQAIGRWGNFMNREAFGAADGASLADAAVDRRPRRYMDVHPTFLYESLWNVIGLLLIYFVVSRARRFDGENTCFYFLWYGLGRFWIEGLRTDSLYLFHWTLFGQRIRVSQALSLVMVLVCAGILVYQFKVKKADGSNLFVKRVQQSAEAEETAASDEQQ